ncbi:ATP-grasp domain-containing protein [Rossellomorea marisflavi]|nr:ATP-grasp domain-containing protein [Rossellomorea marisflavi]
MILGAGILQLPALLKAKDMGLNTIAIDINPEAPGFDIADQRILLSTTDVENVLMMANKVKPDAVITLASDMPIRTVAAIGEKLGLRTISCDTAIVCTDKGKMREKLREFNIPIPEFYVISDLEELIEVSKKFEDNFIVKPADNSGSRGIFLVEDTKNLSNAFVHAKCHSRSGEVIVEEFMRGPEVSVESLTIDGETTIIAITDKLTSGSPHFIEMGHTIPSRVPFNIQSQIKELTKSAITALGINTGPSHTEIIITSQGPKIVEIGARLGGDNITTHLVPLATGVNMVEYTISLALSKEVKLPEFDQKAAAIRYIESKNGILKSVKSLKDFNKVDGVKEVKITKKEGEKISNITNSGERIGYVITQADTPEEATELCQRALKSIQLDILNID